MTEAIGWVLTDGGTTAVQVTVLGEYGPEGWAVEWDGAVRWLPATATVLRSKSLAVDAVREAAFAGRRAAEATVRRAAAAARPDDITPHPEG